jgi:hypothetical protein
MVPSSEPMKTRPLTITGEPQSGPKVVKFHNWVTEEGGALADVSAVLLKSWRNIGQSLDEEPAKIQDEKAASKSKEVKPKNNSFLNDSTSNPRPNQQQTYAHIHV